MDEGVIKYQCHWEKRDQVSQALYEQLNSWRNRVHELGYIGEYPNGIGYGNISLSCEDGTFVISGSGTGGKKCLEPEDYALVSKYDIASNALWCRGRTKASSESLTHAAVYELASDIQAVIHIHHGPSWNRLLNKIPTSRKDVPYGTPEMALEVKRLAEEDQLLKTQIFVMAGHEEGIVSFGKSLEEAFEVLVKYCNK